MPASPQDALAGLEVFIYKKASLCDKSIHTLPVLSLRDFIYIYIYIFRISSPHKPYKENLETIYVG